MPLQPSARPFVLAACLVMGSLTAAYPQVAEPPAVPAQPVDVEPADDSAVAPDSPLASLTAFLDASGSGDWDEASRYLTLSDEQRTRSTDLAQRLRGVIDSLGVIDIETVSRDAGGQLDDGLPPNLEEVAQVVIDGVSQPMRLVRSTDAQGAFWAFTPATVSRIDTWYTALPDRRVREMLTSLGLSVLLRPGFFDILWWQWLAFPIVALVAWGGGRALRTVSRPIVRRLTARTVNEWDDQVVDSLSPPITLAFALAIFGIGATAMGLAPPALVLIRSFVRAGLAFAFFWALWRSTRVLVALAMSRPWATTNPSARSLLQVGSNIARGAIVGIGIIAMMAAFGYPVGTVMAGLGIGGLALAFGAQKTVENVFGSVSLAVDQPFRVGDFVKVEDFVGTVEEIGLRSTRFRTLDRTLVSIPNGKLADQRLESFQARDRMRLATTIGVTYGTTRRQMQEVLVGFERVLREHPRIWPDAMVVKFKEFGASSLDIEIMAWFQVPTWADFQQCREEVLLGFMQVVEDAGSSFAFPTRTVHIVQESAQATAAAEPPG